MQSLYQKYIIRELLAAIALVLAALLALYSFFDLIGDLKNVQGSYTLKHALTYVGLRIPGRLYELSPIAVLIGSLYALTTLARYSEITVLRASGLSTSQLVAVLLKAASLCFILALLIGEGVAPFTEQAAQKMRLSALSNVVGQEFRSGLWLKDGHTFVNVGSATAEAKLTQLRIFEFDEHFQLKAISQADSGVFTAEQDWELTNVIRTRLNGNQARQEKQAVERWQSALNPEILAVLMVAPEQMSLYQLALYTRHLIDNHQKSERYEIALWKKLFYPGAALVMVILALPFAYMQTRSGGISLRIFIGVMIGVSFHMLNGLFSSLGSINSWSPFLSALAPSALFTLIALAMLWWVERR
jgi:lipopolysaccharide export system permease protein